MIAFWERAVLYYGDLERRVRDSRYEPRIEDYALIICDLGQSLFILFGRHWDEKAKSDYQTKTRRRPPDTKETPDLLELLTKYLPPAGLDIRSEQKELWVALRGFVHDYYGDIVKHFERAKFEKALTINMDRMARFMECTRRAWIWLIERRLGVAFDPSQPDLRPFSRVYAAHL